MNIGKGIGGHSRAYRGRSDVWLTPPALLSMLGAFDLDPCAAPEPRPWATAAEMWNSDGLERPWRGRVFLNPPYGPQTGLWLKRLADHGNGVALIFARTETDMFVRQVWRRADAILFVYGRLHFHRPDGERAPCNSGAPSVLIAYGADNVEALRTSGIDGAFISSWKTSQRNSERCVVDDEELPL